MTTYLKSLFAMEKTTMTTLKKVKNPHVRLGYEYNTLVDKYEIMYGVNKQLMQEIVVLQDQIDQLEKMVHYYKVGDNHRHKF